jgi:hypothetical protein
MDTTDVLGRGAAMNKEWAPGTGIIIFLLAIIAAKLHAFDGLFAVLESPAIWVTVIALIVGVTITVVFVLLLMRIFDGFGEVWTGIPERTRFFGVVLLLATTSTFWFVYHNIQ